MITIDQFWESCTEDWANYVAKDKDGTILIYDLKPRCGAKEWKGKSDRVQCICVDIDFETDDWTRCINKRPRYDVDEFNWIGKLCWFWDTDIQGKEYGRHISVLVKFRPELRLFKFTDDKEMSSECCRPLTKEEIEKLTLGEKA